MTLSAEVDEVADDGLRDVGADDVLRGRRELLVLLEQGHRVGRLDDRVDHAALAGHAVVVGEAEPAAGERERRRAVHVLVRAGAM